MVRQRETTTESEEMYLITIAIAVEDGHAEPVPISYLAEQLGVSSVSANQMVRKLESRGFVSYEPYRGVSLTGDGRAVASSILRKRRLWGVFLSDRLGLSAHRADMIACDLEHVTPDDVAELLTSFLGDPMAGPRGRTIPSSDQTAPTSAGMPLTALPAGARCRVVTVDLPEQLASFVTRQGIAHSVDIEVLGVGTHGDCLISVDGAAVHLVSDIATGILVEAP